MEPTNVMLWLSTIFNCNLIFSDGKISQEDRMSQVVSKDPWIMLRKVKGPDSCAVLLLNGIHEYHKALPHMHKIQSVKITVVLMIRNTSEEFHESLESGHLLEFDRYIMMVDRQGIVTAQLSYASPFDANGQAKDRNLTVSVVKYPPFVTTVGLPPKGSDIDVVEALAARMDLNLEFLVTPTFEQLVSVVARGKADFTAAHPGLVVHRYAWGADIVGVDFRRFHFAQRHARPISSLYTMAHPYTGYVWAVTAGTFFSVALLLIFLNMWYGKPGIAFKEITISYIPLISQSVTPNWYGAHERTSFFMILYPWLLLASLWSQAYRSNLLANLIKEDMEKQPQTVKEVVDMGISLHMLRGALHTTFIRESPFEAYRQLYAKNLLTLGGFFEGFTMPDEITEKILAGNAITLVTDDGMADYLHLFSKSQEIIKKSLDGYYLRIGLPLKKEILTGIARFQDFGIIQETMDRTNWKLLGRWRNLQRSKSNHPVVIGIMHVLPIMIVLAIGLCLSGIILVVFELKTAPVIVWTTTYMSKKVINSFKKAYGRKRKFNIVSETILLQNKSI